MPRFAANLSFLFTELPFLDRFEAAAKAGFKAVEIGNPYEAPAGEIAARLKANGLTLALFNTPAGQRRGGRARAARRLPGREKDFDAAIGEALRYCGSHRLQAASTCWRAWCIRARGATTFVANLKKAARKAAGAGVDLRDRADQPPRHPGLLPQQARRGARRSSTRWASPTSACSSTSITARSRRATWPTAIKEYAAAHPPLPDRQPARPRRARRGRAELSPGCSSRSTPAASTAGSAASTGRARGTVEGLKWAEACGVTLG